MGNHRAERGTRRSPSEVRAPRKPLITRQATPGRRVAADDTGSIPVTRTESPAPTVEIPSVPTPSANVPASGPGKRAARPSKPARVSRGATTNTPRPARIAAAHDAHSATIAAPVAPTSARRSAGPVKVGSPATELLTPATGRRRAARETHTRGALLKHLPSAPILAGVAALAVTAGGALTMTDTTPVTQATSSFAGAPAASALGSVADAEILEERTEVVSRDSRRVAASERTEAKLVAKAERMAEQRSKTIKTITVQADKQAAKIEANQWVMPIEGYRLSATFGMSSSLWSTVHTGLDFAAPSGSPLRAVANGVITEVGYDGSYGNKTVLTLDDGTEIWYCHQTSMDVSVGDQVAGGDVIGTVGSTGNSTGPHLHLEIRPGAGGPVDPYSGLIEHGLQP